MNRIYKYYLFQLQDKSVASKAVSFSSSPSFLSSKDDFYIMDTGLVTMETTNSIYNKALYKALTPNSVLTWQRSMLANRMARTSRDWVTLFGMYNSGSYNNQWMAFNFNQFTKGRKLYNDALWIIEQIPGYFRAADVTDYVNKNYYWASYNVPYFPDIFNISGYPTVTTHSYNGCPRANIFRREHVNVHTTTDMENIMQYNNWQNDSFSLGDPAASISSRYDLRTQHAAAFGGIDSKITNYESGQRLWCYAISGPTHQNQTPFEWTDQWSAVVHDGQPKQFNFPYQLMKFPTF